MTGQGETSTTDYDSNKLYRKAVADPGNYDGAKSKFQDWWRNMQLWLLGYEDMTGKAKGIAVLSCLTSGDAVEWARAKKVEIIDNPTIFVWDTFKTEPIARFDDPTRKMHALGEIHNFKQDRMCYGRHIHEVIQGKTKASSR